MSTLLTFHTTTIASSATVSSFLLFASAAVYCNGWLTLAGFLFVTDDVIYIFL
jgi:hypothetical protein